MKITDKKIKSKIKIGEAFAVVENIKYPEFSCENHEKHEKLCSRMNAFYASVAEKYSNHARTELPKRIRRKKIACKLPMVLAMNYTIGLCDENVIGVVIDLTFSEGKNIKMRRFSQMWSVGKGNILSVGEIMKTDRESRKKIHSLILKIAKENGETGTFGYFGDYLPRLSKRLDIRNFFVVPNGLCFFVNAGVLSPVKYGASNFVLSFDSLADVLKDDFLPKMGKKEAQNGNIVNNV